MNTDQLIKSLEATMWDTNPGIPPGTEGRYTQRFSMEFINIITNALRRSANAKSITDQSKEIHRENVEAGWWDDPPWFDPEAGVSLVDVLAPVKIALIHSEVSEGLEGARKDLMDDHLPHRKMEEVELADAMIRIMDLAGARRYDLQGAIDEKREYNKRRQDHKRETREQTGGKKF